MTFTEWMETVPRELPQIIRLLLTIIPSERGYKLHEEPADYGTDQEVTLQDLLTNVPMPP